MTYQYTRCTVYGMYGLLKFQSNAVIVLVAPDVLHHRRRVVQKELLDPEYINLYDHSKRRKIFFSDAAPRASILAFQEHRRWPLNVAFTLAK